ncbi:MAG: hypothetical protein IT371_03945 [Deltaproteobacteria bacterium]|nr:hypothetical protein [Deltaproteobacteria bacterium]
MRRLSTCALGALVAGLLLSAAPARAANQNGSEARVRTRVIKEKLANWLNQHYVGPFTHAAGPFEPGQLRIRTKHLRTLRGDAHGAVGADLRAVTWKATNGPIYAGTARASTPVRPNGALFTSLAEILVTQQPRVLPPVPGGPQP